MLRLLRFCQIANEGDQICVAMIPAGCRSEGENQKIFLVPRCSAWVETLLRRYPEVEFTRQQIDHGLEVSDRAVAAGLGLGGLHQAVDALDQAVGDLAVEPAQDAVPVALDGVRGIDDRFEAAMGGPEIPFLEESGGLGRGLLIELLEGQADLVGPCGLEMTRGEAFERARCRSERLSGLRSQI